MASSLSSNKRLQISKANATVVLIAALSAFVVAFSLVASKALLSQRSYQARVIREKEKAVKQLKDNLGVVDSLVTSYQSFAAAPENVIGGNPAAQGDRDGDNPKIILDALPSKYDFPALTASLEKMLTNPGYRIESITGTDDEVNQQANASNTTPQPVEMPFQIAVNGSYGSMQELVRTLERSIRPMQVTTLELTGSDSQMRINLSAKTFYQPAKNLDVKTKVVK